MSGACVGRKDEATCALSLPRYREVFAYRQYLLRSHVHSSPEGRMENATSGPFSCSETFMRLYSKVGCESL